MYSIKSIALLYQIPMGRGSRLSQSFERSTEVRYEAVGDEVQNIKLRSRSMGYCACEVAMKQTSRSILRDLDFPDVALEVVNLLPLLDEHYSHDDDIQKNTQYARRF